MILPCNARRCLASLTVMALLGTLAAGADKSQLSLEGSQEVKVVRAAMAEGFFDIAEVKTRRLLEQPGWSKQDRSALAGILVQALVRNGKGDAALAALKGGPIDDQPFWEGQALLIKGDYEHAADKLGTYPADGPLAALTVVARAHAFLGQGRESAARSLIKPLRTDPDPEIARHTTLLFDELELGSDYSNVVLGRLSHETDGKDVEMLFLRARALLELHDNAKCGLILRELLTTRKLSERQHDAATIMLAETLWHERSPEAREWLLSFINGFSAGFAAGTADRKDTQYWGEAFGLLERIAAGAKPDDTLLAPALAWAADATRPERQGYALFFIAQQLHRAGKDSYAIGFLETIIQLKPRHPKASDAIRLAMQIHGAQRSDPRVIELAELWRHDFGGGGESVVDFLVGMIRFTRGEYHEALNLFANAADLETDLTRRRRSLYNALICAIKAGEKAVLSSLMGQLAQASTATGPGKKDIPNSGDTPADVELDRALQLAARTDPAAGEQLAAFIRQHPEHPRWPEAQVALAEFSLLDVPPRIKPAVEALAAAVQAKHDTALQERIDYVTLWLNDAMQDLSAVARTGLAFIEAWPHSSRIDEVRMKVGEAFYRLENFVYARTQFELLVKSNRESPYADTALFFAGKAAMAVPTPEGRNAAITIWDELAQRGGPLAIAARQQQAVTKRLQGNDEEALKLMDDLLQDPQVQGDRRHGIECDKAELLKSMGKDTPLRYDQAVSLLRRMLQDKSLPYLWSSRVGVLLAAALEEQGHKAEALEACYDVVNTGSGFLSQPASPSEYLWFYRAGFHAVDLLKDSQQWEAAAKMAEKLAQSSGDRAKAAAEAATRIRLEHFLWDEKK